MTKVKIEPNEVRCVLAHSLRHEMDGEIMDLHLKTFSKISTCVSCSPITISRQGIKWLSKVQGPSSNTVAGPVRGKLKNVDLVLYTLRILLNIHPFLLVAITTLTFGSWIQSGYFHWWVRNQWHRDCGKENHLAWTFSWLLSKTLSSSSPNKRAAQPIAWKDDLPSCDPSENIAHRHTKWQDRPQNPGQLGTIWNCEI